MAKQQLVAILDAGSQYGGLIDRNVRELGVRTNLLPLETPVDDLTDYDAVIISGGPRSVTEPDAPDCDARLFELGKPIFGICYGMQLIAKHLGGNVGGTSMREDGPLAATFEIDSALFVGLEPAQEVLMSHGDSVTELPIGFRIVGRSGEIVAAIEHSEQKIYGTQFHPEVFQTVHGVDIFRNFLFGIAELEASYSLADQLNEAEQLVLDVVGNRDILLFLSGGVDSTVLAALIAEAIPEKSRIHAYHIDTGFMRAGESKAVITALEAAGIAVKLIDATDTFANAQTLIGDTLTLPLNQVIDPQVKRKIIGDTFIKVRDSILIEQELSEDTVLAQGSLRPDLIESGSVLASTKADTIKTHHNDTEAVRLLRAQNRVVEPLQQLYKDQVRAIGRKLGLPESIIIRHPFPGPGLAIRILCADEPYQLDNHDELQAALDSFVSQQGYDDFTATLLPVRTVGVQGDGRSYKYLVGIEGPRDWQRLRTLASIIPNNNHAANRVCYVFTPIDRNTLSVTPTHLIPDVIKQVRTADAIVTELLMKHNLMDNLSQMPVVSFPADFGQKGARAIALRPFKTPDFMTGIPGMPGQDIPEDVLDEMVERILHEVDGISQVAYDLSSKPPGTTEWE